MLAAVSLVAFTGCSDDENEAPVKTPIGEATDIYGVVTDSNGKLLQGVVVSDGYTCAATDENGVYQLTRNTNAYHVFLSLPEVYEVPFKDNGPCFWQQLSGNKERYDFTLRPLAGGAESEFRLFCIADPQCQTTTHISRFTNETVPDIAAQAAASDVPCYAITLGDIIFNNATTDVINLMPRMKLAMSPEKIGMPVFQVMGNHDNAVISVKKEDYTVEHDIAAQRFFEYKFGPVNYSFNRGNAHIVGMDNVIFPNHNDVSCGFRDDQVEWLRQDLSHVSKDKLVILCVHIPLRNSATAQNVQAVLSLLKGFAEVHVMSGHTHYAENGVYSDHYEHVHGAVCGAWWWSAINTDGTPNGYSYYDIAGAAIDNWKYKGTGLDENYQIRLYRADEVFAGDYKFYYTAPDQIVANIWNADTTYWKIEVFENGTKTGEMQPFEASPKRDAWSSGFHCGVLGHAPENYDRTNNSHLFFYTLQNAQAEVEVRATDKFGTVYTQSTFTTAEAADYPAID